MIVTVLSMISFLVGQFQFAQYPFHAGIPVEYPEDVPDVGADALPGTSLASGIETTDVFVPVMESNCEYIEGDDGAEKAVNLAAKLRTLKLI